MGKYFFFLIIRIKVVSHSHNAEIHKKEEKTLLCPECTTGS